MRAVRSHWDHVAWVLAGAALLCSGAATGADAEQRARVEAALAAEARPEGERERDAARRPAEVIEFVGIESGMTVLDVLAGGGWYTEVLSAAVGPEGRVYSHNSPFVVQRGGDAFLEAERARAGRLGNVEPVHGDLAELGLSGVADAAITALNLHDIYNRDGHEGATAFLRAVYEALRPGGVLGVIDHVGVAGRDNAALHRMQPDAARAAILAAGFLVEAESDLLANPADDHTLEIRDPALQRNTDRMLFRARKPEAGCDCMND